MANWKSSKTIAQSVEMIQALTEGDWDLRGFLDQAEIIFAPADLALAPLSSLCRQAGFCLSSQDVYSEEVYGRICPAQLKEICGYAVVGHSAARKAHRDTDVLINQKVLRVLEAGLRPVLCIGENEEQRRQGLTGQVLERQLGQALSQVEDIGRVMILYEPVWAMGSGISLPADEANQIFERIRSILRELYGEKAADRAVLLYAGSVKPANALAYASLPEVDGLAVGTASLDPQSFYEIVKAVCSLS